MSAAKGRVNFIRETEGGPAVCFHAGVIVKGVLFVHGGIKKKDSLKPSNGLYTYDFSRKQWCALTSADSPFLSHHKAVAVEERYVCLIGGWDGSKRIPGGYVYDIVGKTWTSVKIKGFPSGAGLSSHSISVLKTGSIAVFGREGGTRTQRKCGSTFVLDIKRDQDTFQYSEKNTIASRSGHTSNPLLLAGGRGRPVIAIYGGRADSVIEFSDLTPALTEDNLHNSDLYTTFKELVPYCKLYKKEPGSRKNHIALSCDDLLFIHGGEPFNTRSGNCLSSPMLFYGKDRTFFEVAENGCLARAGHVAVLFQGSIFLFGGFNEQNVVVGDLFRISFFL
eukprot:Nk52_evm10s156 gene=Nk52_evmTU10s156